MTKSTFTKTKAQMKSSSYYTFWGIATVAVVAGQIYVGNGYRGMSQSVKDLTEMIGFHFEMELIEKRRGTGPYMPMIDPEILRNDYIIWEEIK